jgi:hypothetical protein
VKLHDYLRFFRNEDEEEEMVRVETARQILDWTGREYHKRFVSWLESMAMAPVEVSDDHMKMIQNAFQCNTYRHIKKYLSRIEEESIRILEQEKNRDV